MTLRTRKPTGQVAYPMVMVEGAEKVGKTYAAFSLSKSEKVGRTFVFDFGEGSGDEYAALGPYELVEHDGTFTDFYEQLIAATEQPDVDGKPNVIVIDSGSVLWEGLKNWASSRAKRSKSNQKLLERDPDAEINVSSTYWNDANDRWGRMLHTLRRWPGITVVICRAKTVAVMGADGNPIPNKTEYKVEAQKNFGYNATAQVRVEGPKKARLVAARSLSVEIPPAGLVLPPENPLEHAIFDVLGAGASWQVSAAIEPQFGRTAADAKTELVAVFAKAGMSDEEATAAAAAEWKAGPCPGAKAQDEVSDDAWAALVAAASARIDEREAA